MFINMEEQVIAARKAAEAAKERYHQICLESLSACLFRMDPGTKYPTADFSNATGLNNMNVSDLLYEIMHYHTDLIPNGYTLACTKERYRRHFVSVDEKGVLTGYARNIKGECFMWRLEKIEKRG